MQRRDVIAGISIAGLMLPEAVAYAGIAGLPPQRAILAAVAGALVYALIGRSRFAIVSPTSSSAAILAAALAVLPGDAAAKMMMVTVMVAMTGVLFAVAALAKMGGLAGFVSRPVLRGFAFGLAVTIILKQLPVITGVVVDTSRIGHLIIGLIGSAGSWHAASMVTGLVALAALLSLRRVRALPGAFLVLGAGIAASLLLDLPAHGVAVVGHIDLIPTWPAWTAIPWPTLSEMAQFTLMLVLILFAESWGTMRGLALRHGDTVQPNRELGALGLSNIAAAMVQGMPVGAGFSAGSAAEAAGAKTRATGAVAAIGVALLMLFAASLVAELPKPVLAAPDAAEPPGTTIWRPAEPLFFANAERILAKIARRLTESGARSVVVSLEESYDLDSTALDALLEFDAGLKARGIELRLARVRDHIRDLLLAAGAQDLASRCYHSVDDAVSGIASSPSPAQGR